MEHQVPCPNNCSINLKRKLLDSHLELECPNMVVECPYKKFGCGQEVLRRELEEHRKTNQIQHFESTSIFAIREMEQLKQTNIQQTETNLQLTKTNIQLIERVITLENEVERLSYPIILRDELVILTIGFLPTNQPIKKVTRSWKFLKISVEFKYFSKHQSIFVFVMENDDIRAPLAKWPFEGRFKLTIIDKMNKCHIYESDLIKLQPRNVSKDKGDYPSELILAEIPHEDLQGDRFLTGRKPTFTLQIQEIENQ